MVRPSRPSKANPIAWEPDCMSIKAASEILEQISKATVSSRRARLSFGDKVCDFGVKAGGDEGAKVCSVLKRSQ